MSFGAEFEDFMPHTVQIAAMTSRDAYAGPSYGAPASYAARVLKKNTWIRAADGSAVVATTVVWIADAPDVGVQDKIILPDGSTPPILSVERYPDETSDMSHTKVMCG